MKPRSKAVLGLFVIVLIAAAALAAELAHRPRLPPVPRGPRVSAPVAAPDRPAPNPLRNA